MFSIRQVAIIKRILSNNQGVHGSAIADALNVSTRTIRNEITEINNIFKNQLIVSNNKTGYSISRKYDYEIKSMINEISNHDDSILREYEILGKVLFNDFTLEDLSDEINYSAQTIKKEIIKLDSFLYNNYQISFLEIESDKVKINASEEEIRFTLFRIVKDVITSGSFDYIKLLEAILDENYKNNLFNKILNSIYELCEENRMEISIENIKILHSALIICIVRNQNGLQIKNQGTSANPILISLMNKLEDLKLEDLALLEKLIHTFKITEYNKTIEINDFSRVVLDEFIDEIFDKYSFNIKESEQLYDNMLIHMEYMLRRIVNGYELRNPIISDIKRKYPFSYEVSMLIVHIVYKYMNKYILDDEVSYLAIYIEHFLENVNEKIRAILISSSRHSINQVIEKWVNTNFKNQITIQKTIDKSRIDEFSLNSFDLILSFNEQIYSPNIETFNFNGLPEFKDISRLNDCIHTYKINQRMKAVISAYVNVSLVKIFNETTFENVIFELSDLLEDKNIIDSSKDFSEDVISREINYPTNLGDTIMMPHSLYTFSNKTAVAVGVIKKGFHHNNETVRLVFLLAIEKVRSSEINFLFQFFKQIGCNRNFLRSLYESENEYEFILNLTNYNSNKSN